MQRPSIFFSRSQNSQTTHPRFIPRFQSVLTVLTHTKWVVKAEKVRQALSEMEKPFTR